MSDRMYCPKHPKQRMVLLFTGAVCDLCNPPKGKAVEVAPSKKYYLEEWMDGYCVLCAGVRGKGGSVEENYACGPCWEDADMNQVEVIYVCREYRRNR
jgi:hypothetical protein